MLCKPTLDLFDSMSSFEVMDIKMDARMQRKLPLTPKQAKQSGILLINESLTASHRRSLYEEFLIQFATWSSQTTIISQTLYSCLYIADKTTYEEDK